MLDASEAANTIERIFVSKNLEKYVRDALWLLMQACGSYIDESNKDDDDTGYRLICSTTAPSTF